MRCTRCGNTLYDWEDSCDECGAVLIRVCDCHHKPVYYHSGLVQGSRLTLCPISNQYCMYFVVFEETTNEPE